MNDFECASALLGGVLDNPVVTSRPSYDAGRTIPWQALDEARPMLSHSESLRVDLAGSVLGAAKVNLQELFGRLDLAARRDVLVALVLWAGVPDTVAERLAGDLA